MNLYQRLVIAFRSGQLFPRLFSFLKAKILFSLPGRARRRMYAGEEYYCPVCESHLRKFLPLFRPYHRFCPVCKSLARHRFFWNYFKEAKLPNDGNNLRILHIAPEEAIRNILITLPQASYLSADLYSKDAMVKMDICNIEYGENSFDLIFCSHVLEHVADDRQAMREFHRVLSSAGVLFLMVPILAEKSFEDPSIIDPNERERVFGQMDHVRVYGNDFAEIVAGEGFAVETYQPSDFFSTEEIQRQQLDPEDRLFVCRKA